MSDAPSVIVVGSGAAGLAAALAAAGSGADVVVLERAGSVGGTSAMSGGVVWLPAHGRGAPSSTDSVERALTYLCALARGDTDVTLMRAFLSDTARVAGEIEKRTPLEWEVLGHWPDYRGELPGAGHGRSMWPRPLRLAPEVEGRIQAAADQPSAGATQAEVGAPANDGVVLRGHVRGRALVGGLLSGVLDAGVDVRTGARVHTLATHGNEVTGVVVDGATVKGRVVVASGGFQHDAFLAGRFLQAPFVAPMGAGGCVGDGLRMALAMGAEVANMSEGWWMPAMRVPGEAVDGVAHYRPLHSERAKPGAIMVDRHGKRFADEAQNYGDVGQAMRHGRAVPAVQRGGGPHPSVVSAGAAGPWWLVFDAVYRSRYPVGPLDPSPAADAACEPDWLLRADDLAGLARRAGLPPEALASTVARFNAGAAVGEDVDYGRGTYPYDRWIGDAGAPDPTLAAVSTPPFYAVEVHLGCMGTKGGPRTDDRGRVLSDGGRPVAGLYAAGNVAASPFGAATPAGGATLGPALVFGTAPARPPPPTHDGPGRCRSRRPGNRAPPRRPRGAGAPRHRDASRPRGAAGGGRRGPHGRASGAPGIPRSRYTSRTVHELEVDKVWRRVWQMACREEQIPETGDSLVYNAPGLSLVVVRSAPDEIRAFHNSCLHRGTQLRTQPGRVGELRCPFHGFTWNLDGSFAGMPCPWDFPHVDPTAFALPEARVGTWGGFVFVTPDPRCEPLPDYLEILPRHFASWDLAQRSLARPRRARGAVQLEGGARGVHRELSHRGGPPPAPVHERGHPDRVRRVRRRAPRQPDDHAGGHRQRARPRRRGGAGHPRRHVPDQGRPRCRRARRGHRPPGAGRADPPPAGGGHRARLRRAHRLRGARRHRVLPLPQLRALGGVHHAARLPLPAGRRRPPQHRHGRHAPGAAGRGGAPSRPTPTRHLTGGERWADAPELGYLGRILDQDTATLGRVQRGLEAATGPDLTLADYQESRIRHFHDTLGSYLDS